MKTYGITVEEIPAAGALQPARGKVRIVTGRDDEFIPARRIVEALSIFSFAIPADTRVLLDNLASGDLAIITADLGTGWHAGVTGGS